MIYEVNHVGILTRDIERTLVFHDALDAQVVFDQTIPEAGTRIVYLQLAGGLVEYIGVPERGEGREPGIDHLAFLSDDLDGDYARLLEAGAIEAVAPKPAGTGVGRISFLYLGEIRIELLERDVELRRPPRADSLVTGLDHYALAAPDLEATAAFLTDVVGLAPLLGPGTGGSGRFLGLGSDAVGLVDADTEGGGAAFPYVALQVQDVDVALAELTRRGLTDVGPGRENRDGEGRRAELRDPNGVRFELLDRSPLPS